MLGKGKILSLMKENQDKTTDESTGIFTTGIISQLGDDREIALVYISRKHAGENIAYMIKHWPELTRFLKVPGATPG